MKKVIKHKVSTVLSKSKNELYLELGLAWVDYKERPFIEKGIPIIRHKFRDSYLIYKGRQIFNQHKSKLKKIICVKFKWCKKSKKFNKYKNPLSYGVILSQIIATQVPAWVSSAILLGLLLKTTGDLDKFCKCKKR